MESCEAVKIAVMGMEISPLQVSETVPILIVGSCMTKSYLVEASHPLILTASEYVPADKFSMERVDPTTAPFLVHWYS